MLEAQLPGYVRVYTGPTEDNGQEQRRIVIHRRASGESHGGADYAVHEESTSGAAWHLHWGDYDCTLMRAIELAQQREGRLLGTASQAPTTRQIHWPSSASIANESYKLADQPNSQTYIELTITVGDGAQYTGRLYRD